MNLLIELNKNLQDANLKLKKDAAWFLFIKCKSSNDNPIAIPHSQAMSSSSGDPNGWME